MNTPSFFKNNSDKFTQVSVEEFLRLYRLIDRRFAGTKGHVLDTQIENDGLTVPVEQDKFLEAIEEFLQNKTSIGTIEFKAGAKTPEGDSLKLEFRWVCEGKGYIMYHIWASSADSAFIRIDDWGRNTLSEIVQYIGGLGDHADATLLLSKEGAITKVTKGSAAGSSVTHNVTNIHNSHIRGSQITTGSHNKVNTGGKKPFLEKTSWIAAILGVPITLVGLWLAWLALK